jgi:hypothetical protein
VVDIYNQHKSFSVDVHQFRRLEISRSRDLTNSRHLPFVSAIFAVVFLLVGFRKSVSVNLVAFEHVSDGMTLEISRTRVRHKIANVCRVFRHIVAVTFWFTSISTSVPVSLVAFEECYDGMTLHAVNDV